MRFVREFVAVGWLLVTLGLHAEVPELKQNAVPSWVHPVELPEVEMSDAGAVAYILVDSQINHLSAQKQHYFQIVQQPMNSQGLKEASELSFNFYPAYEQLVFHDITIIRDGKELPQLDLSRFKLFQNETELNNKLYNEKWTALFILEDVRPKDLIRFSYTTVGHNPVFERHDFGSLYLSWSTPIARMNVDILSKEPLNFRFTHQNYDFQKSKLDGGLRYSLQVDNIAAGPNETQYPYWYEPYNLMQYSAIDSWSEVVKWAEGLYQLDYSLPDDLLKQLKGWQKNLGTEAAITKAIDFVQNDIRYFGIEFGVNSHRPRPPKQILEQRYGDCKDKTVLIMALMKALGVEAYPALVNSTRGKVLVNDLPSPASFDHVIAYVKYRNHDYWIDGTVNMQAGGLAERGLYDYKNALIVKPGQKQLTKVKVNQNGINKYVVDSKEEYKVNVTEQNAQLTALTQYRGLKAEQMRRYFNSNTEQTINHNLKNFYSRFYSSLQELEPYKVTDNAQSNQLAIAENYRISDLVNEVSGKDIVKLVAAIFVDYLYKPEMVHRSVPLAINHPIEITHQSIINIDGDVLWYEPETLEEIDNDWFKFSRKVSRDQQQIRVDYQFISKRDSVEAQDVAEYLEAIDKIDRLISYSFWAKPRPGEQDKSQKRVKNMIKSLIKK
jgi:hypothetical protein